MGIPGYIFSISLIFLSKSWCRTLICIEIFNGTFLQAFVIIFYSIYWTNEAKMKLITQSTTLKPWWVYPNSHFHLFCNQPLLAYLPYSIYLSSTEPKWDTLSKNRNHFYEFEGKFTRTVSFLKFFFRQSVTKCLCQTTFSSTWGPLSPTINAAAMKSLVKLHW